MIRAAQSHELAVEDKAGQQQPARSGRSHGARCSGICGGCSRGIFPWSSRQTWCEWMSRATPESPIDDFKGFAKFDVITYRPRKINSAELRVGFRNGLRAISSSYDAWSCRAASIRYNISGSAKPSGVRELGVDAGFI